MNPNDYPNRNWLWHQNLDIRWSPKKVAISGRTISDIGCAIFSEHYIYSRLRELLGLPFIRPNVYIDWLNAKAKASGYKKYLSPGGNLYWNSLDEFSGWKLKHQYHPLKAGEAGYIMSEYYWGEILHWTVNLNGDIAYNPFITKPVPVITYRNNPQWRPSGRHQYFKIV